MFVASPARFATAPPQRVAYLAPGAVYTLAEHWNGSAWSIQSTPNPEGAKENILNGVACSSNSACTAVGYYKDSGETLRSLAMRWNGSAWALQSIPTPEGATESRLQAVSCPASNACTAVGFFKNSAGTIVTLALRWDGTSWTIQSTPNPSGAKESRLQGVKCATTSACLAVGYYKDSGGTIWSLGLRWNGTQWSIESTPTPEGAKNSRLEGVSCLGTGACTAVGYYTNSVNTKVSLAERWNGSQWAAQSPPNPEGAKETRLQGVSCPMTSLCTAAGFSKNGVNVVGTLAQRWDGTKWKIQPTPNPESFNESQLKGVACITGDGACRAVGYWFEGLFTIKSLVEVYQ